jgi:peptide chain release factor 2
MGESAFWENHENAQKKASQISQIKQLINPVIEFKKRLEDLEAIEELVSEASDEEAQELLREIEPITEKLAGDIGDLEIKSFLSGRHDQSNAIISIHAGAGGTESCDWAEMLLRMYTRWCERRGLNVTIQDLQAGEEAGISRVSMHIQGEFAYGYAKAERGVHRLVRISPFDSNSRRHTSFCAVDVIAEIEDDVDIEFKDDELRVDTYRSSGKGGQHVNKSDTAVRITHLPTGIFVACQNERSQYKNKATALKVLKSRIFEKMEDEKRAERDKFYGEKNEIGWGNQIRSYVFQPYQMVKDLRTGVDTSNIQAVMDGDIDQFVNAWLRAGCPTARIKESNN